jgi:hypothetical protein
MKRGLFARRIVGFASVLPRNEDEMASSILQRRPPSFLLFLNLT